VWSSRGSTGSPLERPSDALACNETEASCRRSGELERRDPSASGDWRYYK
jgi:hypothetical protein